MEIWYANETADDPQPHARPALLPEYPHLLDTGELWIAEVAGVAAGFSGAIKRGNTAFLTDLFVDPQHQSSGLGMQLLRCAFEPYTKEIWFTVSSSDPRALALYIRAGMQPRWPNFLLRAHNLRAAAFDKPRLVITAAAIDDPELWAWDAMICGRERHQDLAFWVEREGGEPLWIMHGAERVGYAIVRLRGGTIWQPHAARIGPMGVRSPQYAAAASAAVVQWAAERANSISIDLLGPHPGLAVLLEAGFRITYVETFMLAGEQPFFDPRCYNGSGGALF
jgi:GNAT superfamily N-acetyltransferase